ncbi:MAG: hypothetical protein ACRDWY_12155, partial [Actinomycetes bacterium]
MPRRGRLDEERLAVLALGQDHVVSRDQLAFLGADRHAVSHRVDTGRWLKIGPRVVLLGRGELTFRQRLWVAVLHSGPEAALAGLTALEAEGLKGFSASTLHTVVPHGSDATDLVDQRCGVTVRVSQSRRLSPDLVHPARTPARLLLPQAVVDAASQISPDSRGRLLVISTVQQRLARPSELRAVVHGRARLVRRPLILEAIDDVEGGIHSLPERDWNRAIRRYGLPVPVCQRRVQRADGTWYLDADFDPYGVGVEINGTQHLVAGRVAMDDHRRNVLGTRGRLMITIGSHTVRHQPGVAVVAS